MKKNYLFIFYLVLVSILLAFSIVSIVNAEENRYELSFAKEPTYELTNTIMRDDEVIGWSYEINVYIQNTGDIRSEEIVVNLTDSEGFTLKNNTYFEPGETKVITFLWSTVSSKDQTIHVSYKPTDIDAVYTEFNKDYTEFNIVIGQEDKNSSTENTPGFEIFTVIFVLIFYAYYKKRKG